MSHDLLVQMAYCLFKCGKRQVVVENLAVLCYVQLLKGDVRLARDLLNYIHTKKKEIKEKTNIITLTNLKLLPMQSQGIIM